MTSLKATILYKELQNLGPELKSKLMPQKGKDYFTPEEVEQIVARFKPVRGVDYYDGLPGKQGEKGEKGDKGEKPDVKEIIREVLKLIPRPKDGKDGKNATLDEKEIITSIMEKVAEKLDIMDFSKYIKLPPGANKQALAKWGAQHLRHGGGDIIYYKDISDQITGSTRVYTLPANRKVIAIHYSSSPFSAWKPTTDYKTSGKSNTILTFDNSIPYFPIGQTLAIQYIV